MDDDHVEKVPAVSRQNRHLTVHEVVKEVGICKISCQQTKDALRCCKFMPRLLTNAQKENRVTVSQ